VAPVALTLNVTDVPTQRDAAIGCVVITGTFVTVTKVGVEFCSLQTPLFTTALKYVDVVKAPDTKVLLVFAIVVGEPNPIVADDSQRTILPVCPANVKVPDVKPSQIVVPPVTVPPTVEGSTVTVVEVELSSAQAPLLTIAL
jgi:hypothetical protein